MAALEHILYTVRTTGLHGSTGTEVKGLTMDSRQVAAGYAFIAVRGVHVDGHQFIEAAIDQGATAVVCEEMPEWLYDHVTYVRVEDSTQACGVMAANFYGHPSRRLQLVGVTGTNGKTTIATLLFGLFRALGHSCGLLSTVHNRIDEEVLPATHTTPDAIQLQALLARMADHGCSHVFMEVSSHAIHQQRIAGLEFRGGIFSNITHDHLDYHKTFDEYIRVKKSFFDQLPPAAFALTNADDRRGAVMLQNTGARKASYGLKGQADFKGRILENLLTGLVMSVDGEEVHFRLVGEFNAYNLLAAYGAACLLGMERREALLPLSNLTGAEGRFDGQRSPVRGIMGIVDYAHTPDALLNVLATIQNLRREQEQIITVVGCGGDRDKAKRPLMAEVAARHSDRVILTSDNPRGEDPMDILREMEAGIPPDMKRRALTIPDRREAIKAACSFAGDGDIVLVAGKGHEKYQEIAGQRYPFDDKAVLRETFEALGI